MTDFHCNSCRRRVRLYHHEDFVICTCGRHMQQGCGKRTKPDVWHPPKRRPRYDEPPEWLPR